MSLPYTLRQLEVFAEVARSRHLTQAAGRLHLTQSAASTALRQFEAALGGPLFTRTGRRLHLNERGRLLFPQAEALLASARGLLDTAGASGAQLAGHLVVACSTTIGNYLMPARLAAFNAAHPGVEVTLRIGNTGEVATWVHELRADVGLVEGDVQDRLLDQREWLEDELVVIAPPSHPLAGRGPMDLSHLVDEQWLTREHGSGTLRTIERALEEDHLRLLHAHELGHTEAIKRAVEAGLGVSCLSRRAVERELAAGILVQLPLRKPLRRWFRILSLAGAPPLAVSRAFQRWLFA